MKLSEILKKHIENERANTLSKLLGWVRKTLVIKAHGANNELKDKAYCRGYITALTSCDREIDREALANVLFNRQPYLRYSREEMKEWADSIISTMPNWLKRSEDK